MLEGAHGTLIGLLGIIADWLQLSRINSGDIVGGMKETELWPLLEKIVEDMQPFAKDKGITLRLDPPPDSCTVSAHPESIGVVFKNLVSNAIKYNRESGTVALEGLCVDGNLRVQVRDTGIGIPEKELPFIFEDFFRVTSSQTADIPGTGLGLSIVKKIVEGHHGTIGVQSKEGEGTVFEVQLPLVACEEAEDQEYD
jgi:signal transduction histidine kinase